LLTWPRFRRETEDDSLQPTIDMLLNISVFLWFGAVCPWADFRNNDVIPIWRLILLGITILLFRRLPVVFAMHKKIRQIEEFQQAAFVGFFGPIGVSAIFYLYVSIDFLRQIKVDGVVRDDAVRLEEVMRVVIWFLAICSIIVHGLSIPLGKLGYHLPRTMSQALSTEVSESEPDLHAGPRPGHRSTSQLRRVKNSRLGRDKDRRPSTGAFMIGQGLSTRTTMDLESQLEPHRPVNIIEDPPLAGPPAPVTATESQTDIALEQRASKRVLTFSNDPAPEAAKVDKTAEGEGDVV
jgi:hypothetical protein